MTILPDKKEIHVVAGIIIQNQKILATQRGYGEFKDGWEFPGGKIEPNETKEEALIRELKEELNIEIEVIRFFTNVDYEYSSFILHMDSFLCRIKRGQLDFKEHEDFRWLSKATLESIDWLPADWPIAQRLKKEWEEII